MKKLFVAILAVSLSLSALPGFARDSISNSKTAIRNIPTGEDKSLESSDSQSPFSQSPFSESPFSESPFSQRTLAIARQIPANAMGLMVVDTDLRSWRVFEQFKIPFPNATDNWLSALDDDSPMAIAKDVIPWVGTEIAIVFLSETNSKQSITFAAITKVVNDGQFALFLKKVKTLGDAKPTETLYQNVSIWEWKFKDDEESIPLISQLQLKSLAIAKLPSGYAAIASNRQAIQKIIDNSIAINETKPLSLADSPLFQRSLNNPLWNASLIAGYGDLQEIGKLVEVFAADLPENSEIPGFSRGEYIQSLKYSLQQYRSFDLFTWVTPKGIRSQGNTYFTEQRSPKALDRNQLPNVLPSSLPSNIYAAFNSRDFNRQWQWLVNESKPQPTYKILVEGLRMLNPLILAAGLNLDIEKDIIAWMDGEYAVTIFPSDRSPFKDLGVNFTLGALIRTSRPEVANATFAKLTKYFSNMDKQILQVKKRQIGATLLTSFEFAVAGEEGKTQSIFAYGWRDHQTLLLAFGSDNASVFIPTPNPSLAEVDDFREAIAAIPQPNLGHFYLNVNAIAKSVAKFILFLEAQNNPDSPDKTPNPELPQPLEKILNKLGGASFAYSETSDRLQSDLFLGLKP